MLGTSVSFQMVATLIVVVFTDYLRQEHDFKLLPLESFCLKKRRKKFFLWKNYFLLLKFKNSMRIHLRVNCTKLISLGKDGAF